MLTMANIIISPSKYVQGKGELSNFGSYASALGSKLFCIVSPSGLKRVKAPIEQGLAGSGCEIVYEEFNGECSKSEINRLISLMEQRDCDAVVGIGGGKILDTAKAVAYYKKTPVAVVPTIASTDAPCSALSVLYTDDGVFDEYLFLPANPNLVLLDTELISKAPARLLVSGMGDALATYFEAQAVADSGAGTCAGGQVTNAALALARLCYETLLSDGLQAKLAVERKVCTKAVENIVEANTYLSGIGFESGGLSGAHAIHNGFTVLSQCHHLYHGEKVAFGTLAQLVLQNAPLEQIEEVLSFCMSVGLPTTLADLGIAEIKEEEIMAVAQAATAEGESIHNMPFPVTVDQVYAAILGADAIGTHYKSINE